MKSTAKRVLTIVVGWAFILLGIAGLFLPILQGILFIMVGLIILSTEYVWAHHLLQKLRAQFPRIAHLSDEAKIKAELWMDRLIRRKSKASPKEQDTRTDVSRESDGCVHMTSVPMGGPEDIPKA